MFFILDSKGTAARNYNKCLMKDKDCNMLKFLNFSLTFSVKKPDHMYHFLSMHKHILSRDIHRYQNIAETSNLGRIIYKL
jgi:hypothetical protein